MQRKRRKNKLVTQPHPWGLMCRLSCIRGPATAMQTRSRYVMIASNDSRPTTRCWYFILVRIPGNRACRVPLVGRTAAVFCRTADLDPPDSPTPAEPRTR